MFLTWSLFFKMVVLGMDFSSVTLHWRSMQLDYSSLFEFLYICGEFQVLKSPVVSIPFQLIFL